MRYLFFNLIYSFHRYPFPILKLILLYQLSLTLSGRLGYSPLLQAQRFLYSLHLLTQWCLNHAIQHPVPCSGYCDGRACHQRFCSSGHDGATREESVPFSLRREDCEWRRGGGRGGSKDVMGGVSGLNSFGLISWCLDHFHASHSVRLLWKAVSNFRLLTNSPCHKKTFISSSVLPPSAAVIPSAPSPLVLLKSPVTQTAIVKVYTTTDFVRANLNLPNVAFVDDPREADLLWFSQDFGGFKDLQPGQKVNQFVNEKCLTYKHNFAELIRWVRRLCD